MKCRKRKEELFEEIYRKYEHEVYIASVYFTQEEHAAKEIMQKSFFNLYLHFEKVDPEKARRYLLTTVRNLSYNWVRDSKRLRNGMIEDLNEDEIYVESVEDVYFMEEEQRIVKEFSESILSQLYQKNKRWFDAIMLVYYLGESVTDVAEKLGVSSDVISSRLYRAKQWIRVNYEEQYEERVKRS